MRSWMLVIAVICLMLAAPIQAEEGAIAPELEAGSQEVPGDEAADADAVDPLAAPEPLSAEPAAGLPQVAEAQSGDAEIDSAGADASAAATAPAAGAPGLDDFDAPVALASEFEPAAGAWPGEAENIANRTVRVAELGPLGVDENGVVGRIHTVAPRDTLWDISATYLGTPWVWPSIWKDNDEIENPHRIDPGDRVWITAGEIRIISDDEADQRIANQQQLSAAAPSPDFEPAELVEAPPEEMELAAEEVPAALDELPVVVPLEAARSSDTGRSIRVAEREVMGFVSTKLLEAATSIVDSPTVRTYLVEGDALYLGLGEGDVEPGDEFTVFRDVEPVRDVEGGRLLGYHVDVLGWAVVREVHGETSTAELRMTQSEVKRGDQVMPREPINLTVPIKVTPEASEGQIVFMPADRTRMGDGDHVYVNRGSLHGFEEGSEVEVYVPGRLTKERVKNSKVLTPDLVIAHMVLVEVKPDSSVAFVTQTHRELEVGDLMRPVVKSLASR